MSNVLMALPSTYRSNPVIPFMPNADGDREHSWEWNSSSDAIPSGLTIAAVKATAGTETFPLQYVGLTRSDARTLEAFVETQAGRKIGFWCPTFQQEFYTVPQPSGWSTGGFLFIREWGYGVDVFPLGTGFRHFFATRGALRLLGRFTAVDASALRDAAGFLISGYTVAGGAGATSGDATTLAGGGTVGGYATNGLRVGRCHWVRFADDAITTEWAHPNLATITLRVTSISGEAP
jgi:hypothetical protein